MMLERPDSGTVSFDGIDPFQLRGAELLKFRRRVQMVFQDPFASLNSRMTAGDIVAEPWRTHKTLHPNRKDREMRVRGLFDMVGLGAKAVNKYPQEFSGGQRQRIGIARALALNPDVIICDEPVSALDLSVQAQVLNLLNDLQQELGISYIFISARSVGGPPRRRSGHGDVPGPHDRKRPDRGRLREPAPSLYRGADVGGSETRCGPT